MQCRPKTKSCLNKTLFVLPSLITLSSVFCGFDAIRVASGASDPSDYSLASTLIVLAMFLDMLDGRVARMTRTQSAIGVQLDSLADVISFGVAPAVLVYHWCLKQHPTVGFFVSFIYVAAGAIRLARFNVLAVAGSAEPDHCGTHFLGLPIPAAAAAIVAMVMADQSGRFDASSSVWLVMVVVLVLGLLMVSRIRFRSFKRISLNMTTMLLFALMVGSTAVVGIQIGAWFILLWMSIVYLSMTLVESLLELSKRKRRSSAAQNHPSGTTTPDPWVSSGRME